MNKTVRVVAPFFVLLLFGLLLGDGLQSVVETYGVAIALVLWFFRFVSIHIKYRTLPRPLPLAWTVVFGAVLISAAFSDSRGYSLSWIVRLASGFLVYRYFFDIATAEIMWPFVVGVLLFSGVASAFSCASLFFPWFRSALPSMNLLSMTYGHNHLADLLVFIAPIVVALERRVTGAPKWILLILYVASLISTFARGAWLVVGLYSVYVLITYPKTHKSIRSLVIVFLLYIGSVLLFGNAGFKGAPWFVLRRQTVVTRLEYLRQALENFRENPLLGSGPGTFSLISKHQEKIKQSESWFAHSEPFQIAAEMGLVGLLAFGWLLFSHVHQLHKSKYISVNTIGITLTESVVLLLVYASFEFVLDYFVTWLLFWATVGFLVGLTLQEQPRNKGPDLMVKLCCAVVILFYGAWITSNTVTLFTRRYDLAFYLAPFDAISAVVYLSPEMSMATPPHPSTELLLFFHRKNPNVLYALSQKLDSEGIDPTRSFSYAEQAAMTNPQNMTRVLHYLSRVALLPSSVAGTKVFDLLKDALPSRLGSQLAELSTNSEAVGKALQAMYSQGEQPLKEGYVSLVYSLGLQLLYKEPRVTERLWILARDIYPDLATVHLELAGLYTYLYKDSVRAKRVLDECQQSSSARHQCALFATKGLRPPGEYSEELR